MSELLPSLVDDPVIEAYKPGVDVTLIRENLKLTHEERLNKLIALKRGLDALRAAGEAAGLGRGQSLKKK